MLKLTTIELVTHPVRMRILLALTNAERTTQQLTAVLDDVPTSSLYRQLQILLDARLVEVVAERQVRGTVEKTLRIMPGAATLGAGETAALRADDLRRAFLILFTQLYHELDAYLEQPDAAMERDMVGFRTTALYATDAEWRAAIQQLNAAVLPLIHTEPGAGRKLRRIATVALVAPAEPQENT